MKRLSIPVLSTIFIIWDNAFAFITTGVKFRPLSFDPLKSSDNKNLEEDLSLAEEYSVVIGKGSTLDLEGDGTLTFADSLLVEGTLIGSLKCLRDSSLENTLVKIGIEGELQADVQNIAIVEVLGKLTGDVFCRQLIIGPGAQVVGNIMTEFIHIAAEASIFGSIATGAFASEFKGGVEVDGKSENLEDEINGDEQNGSQKDIYDPITSANVYHDIVQKAALKKGRAAGLGLPKSERLSARATDDSSSIHDWKDDFGKEIISLDPNRGKYVDSFGHPLIRGADDDQVASFREIRNLSSRTRHLLDTHRKEKERNNLKRKQAGSEEGTNPIIEKKNEGNDDDGNLPSFLR